jgi:hypothetical protein
MSAGIGDPPEPRLCNFMVIRDPPVTIRGGEDIDRTFNFFLGRRVWPSNTIIVSFVLTNTEELQLEVNINGVGPTQNYSPGPARGVHRVLSPVGRYGENQLNFLVHQGSCIISDVVILYYVTG